MFLKLVFLCILRKFGLWFIVSFIRVCYFIDLDFIIINIVDIMLYYVKR